MARDIVDVVVISLTGVIEHVYKHGISTACYACWFWVFKKIFYAHNNKKPI